MAIYDWLVQFHRQSSVSRVVDAGDINMGPGNPRVIKVQCIDDPPDSTPRTLTLQQGPSASGPWTDVQDVSYQPDQGPLEFRVSSPVTEQFLQLNIDAGPPVTLDSGVVMEGQQTNL